MVRRTITITNEDRCKMMATIEYFRCTEELATKLLRATPTHHVYLYWKWMARQSRH